MNFLTKIGIRYRCLKYKLLSGGYSNLIGKPILTQPLIVEGNGQLIFGKNVQIGVVDSPGFWTTYAYVELREPAGKLELGDGVILNNNASISADNARIFIGKETVIGVNFTAMTSDGHSLNPTQRHQKNYPSKDILIGENVFVGDNVTILKGVRIGNNSTIGANSVVTKDIPANTIAAGNPARCIRTI